MANWLNDEGMMDLFRSDAEAQCRILTDCLFALEEHERLEEKESQSDLLKRMMRATHSLKGAAQIVGLKELVKIAHALESEFEQKIQTAQEITGEELDRWFAEVARVGQKGGVPMQQLDTLPEQINISEAAKEATFASEENKPPQEEVERKDVRLGAEKLDELLYYAGQSIVVGNKLMADLGMLSEGLRRYRKRLEREVQQKEEISQKAWGKIRDVFLEMEEMILRDKEAMDAGFAELDRLHRRNYQEVVEARLRPFGDISTSLRLLVRSVSRELEKEVLLKIVGEETGVDRDLLDKLESPLVHLIKNALDHGLESPKERAEKGKSRAGTLHLEVMHQHGWLMIILEDDGRGLERAKMERVAVQRGKMTPEQAAELGEQELIAFLFLPGLSLSDKITQVSGRGVGLDAVQAFAQRWGGSIRMSHRVKEHVREGLRVELRFPISLSLIKALVVGVDGECLAFPMARVKKVLKIKTEEIRKTDTFKCGQIQIGKEWLNLVKGAEVMGYRKDTGYDLPPEKDVHVLMVEGSGGKKVGVIVDSFIGDQELAVQRLDTALGEIKPLSATAVLPDGKIALVINVEEFLFLAAENKKI